MKILALEHELSNATADGFQQYAIKEARKVWDLVKSGVVRETYFRADRSAEVFALECQTADEREALSALPFVKNQLITFELIPLKAYPGFERLFV